MSTIFTKIINGDIPCYKIWEDEKHFAFLDINPASEGHTLIVPKKEVDYIFDLSEKEVSELMKSSQKIAKAIDNGLNCIRTGIIVQGMEVPHAHVHLIPIYDAHQNFSLGKKVTLSGQQMLEIANKIKSELL